MPNEILDELNRLVRMTLTSREGLTMKDGMDVAFACVDTDKNVLYFSGANNPLWIIREFKNVSSDLLNQRSTVQIDQKALVEVKSTKQPIGMYSEEPMSFEINEVKLFPGDQFYLFSDRYADQFGGEKGKKLKYKPFKKLLLETSYGSMSNQSESFLEAFQEWKGDFEQVDDVCIIGVRL